MRIISNLATSIDGKIATAGRELFPLGTPYDRKMMQVIRKKCDAVVMGATTLRSYGKFCGIQGSKRQPANVVVSSRLEGISARWEFFSDPERKRILFVNADAPESKLKAFRDSCRIFPLVPGRPVAPQIVTALSKLKFSTLLVEGGGSLMWDFASLNLIDEYYLTLTPRVLGGRDAPTLVDGKGFAPRDVVNLRLHRCKRVGDELYLVYRKTLRRGR